MERCFRQRLADRLGHAEIDHFGNGRDVMHFDQHVAGLDVAVNQAFLVRVLKRLADRDEQLQSLAGIEFLPITEFGDRIAFHELHHEIGSPRIGRTGIQHPGDVGVIHQGQRLSFGLKSRDNLLSIHARLDDFQSHHTTHGNLLLGSIDDTHAS